MSDIIYSHCLHCNKKLGKRQRKYCSLLCSRTVNGFIKKEIIRENSHCLNCNKKLTGRYQKKYCSVSCGTKYSAQKYTSKKCNYCKDYFLPYYSAQKFCSRKCFNLNRKYQTKQRILNGTCTKTNSIKDYLIKKNGHQCEICNLIEWNSQSIPLDIHHINGDSSDNNLSNLIILCPNCHRQTDNYGFKNFGNPLGKEIRQKRHKYWQ